MHTPNSLLCSDFSICIDNFQWLWMRRSAKWYWFDIEQWSILGFKLSVSVFDTLFTILPENDALAVWNWFGLLSLVSPAAGRGWDKRKLSVWPNCIDRKKLEYPVFFKRQPNDFFVYFFPRPECRKILHQKSWIQYKINILHIKHIPTYNLRREFFTLEFSRNMMNTCSRN